jgi:unsaturated rhamnogalacturonyl hydrolase
LSAEYAPVLEKAYQGMIDGLYYDEDGRLVLGGVCTGTCIEAGTYEHYIKRAQVKNDLHGAGAFTLMCAEMELYFEEMKQMEKI